MANTTVPNGTLFIRELKMEDHLKALVAVLRSCQATQVPVRLRLDGPNGPISSGRIKAVHRHNGMEFATTDVPVNERLSTEAIWLLDIRNVYSVEVMGPRTQTQARREARAHTANDGATATPPPRKSTAGATGSTRAKATASA